MKLADRDQLNIEFDRQVENLLEKGHSGAAGVKTEEFIKRVEPLKKRPIRLTVLEMDPEKGCLPFVIVTKSAWVSADKAMSFVARQGMHGAGNPHTWLGSASSACKVGL